MADKNVKAELNADDLEEVAGGATAEVKTIDITGTSKHLDEWTGVKTPESTNKRPPEEELKNQPGRGNIDNPKIKF